MRLGTALQEAESLYGPRDMSFTVLGVDFSHIPSHIYHPFGYMKKSVLVRLNAHLLSSEKDALTDLSHEVIHLLNPTLGRTTVLEEGIATRFAVHYVSKVLGVTMILPPPGPYREAAFLVGRLEAACPGAARALRETNGPWRGATPEQILRQCRDISRADARALASPFG